MENYEGVFIIDPGLKEEEAEACIKGISQSIISGKGEIIKEERWGKKPLAYTIHKHREGNYCILNFKAPTAIISKLRDEYKLMPSLIRFMIIKI